MKDTLTLSPDMLANLECKVGEEKMLTVPVRVTAYGGGGATFEVTDAPTLAEPPADETEPASVPEEADASGPGAMADMLAKRKSY